MAKSKKQAITTEENVDLLNLEDKVSETPATLVAPSPDNSYEANSADGSKLSPNPAGSGFTSQRLVDTLPETGLVNVLYIVPIKNAGEKIVGYKKFRWDLETRSWLRVFGSIPALSLVDGGREQKAIVTNPNREKPKVFNERVVFNNEVYIGGRKVTGEDKEGTYVEGNPADDGETHQELVRIQIGDEQFDIPTEQGDEDIISQITKEYDEESGCTIITFPKGIAPLSITFNTHQLYFKDGNLVDFDGNEVEGYVVDDYYTDVDTNYYILLMLGDISEQVINNLVYIKYDGTNVGPISDTLILFNPSLYSGTKWYLHKIAAPNNSGYIEILTTYGSRITQADLYRWASSNSYDYTKNQITINNVVYPIIVKDIVVVGDRCLAIARILNTNYEKLLGHYVEVQYTSDSTHGNYMYLQEKNGYFTTDGSAVNYGASNTNQAYFYDVTDNLTEL